MTKLSVNINKIATLRNARGGNIPDVLRAAVDCQRFGAQGITVHPRPDERHIRYGDARDLRAIVTTEYNIEGNPQQAFVDLVLAIKPEQVTLVPDAYNAITSNAGWDTLIHAAFLKETVNLFHLHGIRTSIFVDPIPEMITGAAKTGTDRIELYTESYSRNYAVDRVTAIAPFITAAEIALKLGLGINAGHDLDLENLHFFKSQVPGLLEVSIGHALISDALYFGLENTIQIYLRQLE